MQSGQTYLWDAGRRLARRSLKYARRLASRDNTRWAITVGPAGEDGVTVTLPARAYGEASAARTDNRPLTGTAARLSDMKATLTHWVLVRTGHLVSVHRVGSAKHSLKDLAGVGLADAVLSPLSGHHGVKRLDVSVNAIVDLTPLPARPGRCAGSGGERGTAWRLG